MTPGLQAGDGRPSPSRDAGASLVELLVAMVVSGVLLSVVGTVMTSSVTGSRRTAATVAASADARLAMDVVGRRLRVAVRPSAGAAMFTEARADRMTFTASLSAVGSTADPVPSTVTYAVDAGRGCLLETVTPASGTGRSTCLAYGTVTPVFAYYQVTKRPTAVQPSPSPAPTTPLPLGSTGLNADDMGRVGAVEVQLTVRAPGAPAAARPVALRSRFLLVNDLNEETA